MSRAYIQITPVVTHALTQFLSTGLSDRFITFADIAPSHTHTKMSTPSHLLLQIAVHNRKWRFMTKNEFVFSLQFAMILLACVEHWQIWQAQLIMQG